MNGPDQCHQRRDCHQESTPSRGFVALYPFSNEHVCSSSPFACSQCGMGRTNRYTNIKTPKNKKNRYKQLSALPELTSSIKKVYRRRYEKPLLAARCCHLANDNKFHGRPTNERTDDKQMNGQNKTSLSRKAPTLRGGAC